MKVRKPILSVRSLTVAVLIQCLPAGKLLGDRQKGGEPGHYPVHHAGVIALGLTVIIAGEMLKIGTVKWQGKCSRHPMFDPEADGPAAIRGGCPKCQDLQTIFDTQQQMVKLMRTFSPPPPPKPKVDPDAGRQQSLFASFG